MYDIVNSHLTTYSNLSHINVFILAQKILNKLHGTVDFSGIISDSQEGDPVVTNESDEASEDKQLNSQIKEELYNTVKQDLQQNLQLNDLVNIGDETP